MNKLSRKKIEKFWEKRTQVEDPRIATHFKNDDTLMYDLKLIRRFINPTSNVLDLGCGTCAISNEIIDEVDNIFAVDKYSQFLKYCKITPKLQTHIADLLTFDDNNEYDVILLFGMMNYFSEVESARIYKTTHRLLKKNGVLIVKHACGVGEDVFIDKYSEKIGDEYHAIYRSKEKEEKILHKIFSSVEIVDIYPKELNPWSNTHYWAFICKR